MGGDQEAGVGVDLRVDPPGDPVAGEEQRQNTHYSYVGQTAMFLV